MRTLVTFLVGLVLVSPLWAQEDSWQPIAPMPTARESVAACTIGEHIYAIGGFPGGSDRGIRTVERYTPATNSWATMADMPTGRRMPVAVTVGGKCYAIGGRLTDFRVTIDTLDVVEVYDPEVNAWSTVSPLPQPLYAHSGVSVGGKIYVVGGGPGNALSRELYEYDPVTDTWTNRAPMPTPRALVGAAALNGKIYVMGGTIDADNQRYALLEIYDPVTDTWTTGADMPSAKFSFRAEPLNGRIYAFGGTTGPGALKDAAEYDPVTDSWRVVSSMATQRTRFASAVMNEIIYAIGGTTTFIGIGGPHVGMDLAERYIPPQREPSFAINAGLSDAWYSPATAGQGLLLTVFPEQKQVFVAWFTFDTERPAQGVTAVLGAPGQRWLTAQGPFEGDTATLSVFVTEGGVFDQSEPVPTTQPAGSGSMTIEFADCTQALVTYNLPSVSRSGTIPIQRIVNDNVALCQALATSD